MSGLGLISSCSIPIVVVAAGCLKRLLPCHWLFFECVVAPLAVAFGQGGFSVRRCVCCRCLVAAPYAGSRRFSGRFPGVFWGWARWANFGSVTAPTIRCPRCLRWRHAVWRCGCVLDLRRLRLPFPPVRLSTIVPFLTLKMVQLKGN